jgi:hypothetical protein
MFYNLQKSGNVALAKLTFILNNEFTSSTR